MFRIFNLKLFQRCFLYLQNLFRCCTNYKFIFRYLIHLISDNVLRETCVCQRRRIQLIIILCIILLNIHVNQRTFVLRPVGRYLDIDQATLHLQWFFFSQLILVIKSGDASFSQEVLLGDVAIGLVEVGVQLASVEFLSYFHVFDCFADNLFLLVLAVEGKLVTFCLFFVLCDELLSSVEQMANFFDIGLEGVFGNGFASLWNDTCLRHIRM